MTTTANTTTAERLLECLVSAGIDYVFANLGTDHVPIIEALAKRRLHGKHSPEFILCPHENIAVHMALGYASATGKGQAVMVHVDAGTANAAMGIHNAARTRVPVLLMAGKSPFAVQGELPGGRDNYVHFVQDPFDIGSLVRPYVKWEYVLMSDCNIGEVTRRAHSVMHTEPCGPAYLVMPREVLAAPATNPDKPFGAAQYGTTQMGGLSASQIENISKRLFESTDPVLVSSYLGRNPLAPPVLEQFCDCFGVRVVEANPTHLNIARDCAWASGFDASKLIGQADTVVLLDTDVPWLPKFAKPRPDATCIQMDVDASKSSFPMWGFGAEVRIQTDSFEALTALIRYAKTHATEDFLRTVQSRKQAIEKQKSEASAATGGLLSQAKESASSDATGVVLKPILQALNKLLSVQDIVVNEAIRNAPVVLGELTRTEPGTYFSNAGGGLGASSGWALGLKLAHPERRVVQIVGDGSFHFCTPTSFYAVSRNRRLPILTIVLNNGGWQAVKEAVLRMYPEGDAFDANKFQANLDSNNTRFSLIAEAFGAKGLEISSMRQVDAVLKEALAVLDAGTSVLIDLKLPPIE